ncbi:hypothetical protein Pan44_23230 [Caulifigura coniformis]|uniref:Uncharacterized protein n=1 Tax=Caulifigura coniformis TaxID=2527983 RepID=A0A517SDU5_9PLAN|nr:hypothetical protein [Caulifigura coniformis]QDT54295.1 hypothetical protein Pan44_23230 [Caulifigura coniformis]
MTDDSVIPRLTDAAANAANCLAIDREAGDTRYRHIVAWGKFLGFTPATVRRELDRAEAENAPTNAIQRFDDGWHTVDTIANEANRARVEELARP